MHDIAFLHDVILAFKPQATGLFGSLLTAAGDEIIVGDHFGANEALLEVGVNLGGAARGALRLPV
jgi:hypothetical protein